jgi:DNA helicase-2/ATP-dependent DNA helicase PcrA
VDHEDATIPAVVDWIDLSTELGESPLAANEDWTDVNAVNILTVHSAKGLEFPVVFLVNLASQRFPTSEKKEQIPIPDSLIKEILPKGDFHLQEERRLFYVGMTRAKERLYFTAADYYGEGKREKKLSPFIFEAIGDKAVGSEVSNKEQLSFLDYKKDTSVSKEIKAPPIHIDYLSYSQIETFKTCPLHYKLKYILNIPTPPSASQSFGTSLHAALRDFYNQIKNQKPTRKFLLDLLKGNWIREGYHSKSHEERFFEKGVRFLTEYLKSEFNPKTKTLLTEQSFTIPFPNTEFKIPSVRPLRIGGRIDRVDELSKGVIEIIDYKTGANVPTQKEIDRDLQMTFYALAAVVLKEPPFNKKPEEVKMTFYYFDNQKKISTIRTKEQLEEAVKEIFKTREEMEKSDFVCSGSFLCKNCEYKMLCNSEV